MLLIFSKIYSTSVLLYGVAHLWFLLMLFGLFLLAPMLWNLLEKVKNDRKVTLLVLSSFLLYPLFSNIAVFQITKVFYFLPYFLLGYLLIRRGHKALYTDWIFWISLLGTAIILYMLVSKDLFFGRISREYASMIVIIALTFIPNITISDKRKKIVSFFSINSMGIYLFHQIIVALFYMNPTIKPLLDSHNPYVCVLILFVVVTFLSLSLTVVFNKFKLTRFFIGSKI